jgi:hypothetical protein
MQGAFHYVNSIKGNISYPYVATICSAESDCNATMGYYADVTTKNRDDNVNVNYFLTID